MNESHEFKDILLDALDNISEAFVIYDKDGYLVTCNEKFRTLYGYSAEEAAPGVHFRTLGEIDVARGNVAIGDEFGSDEEYLERKAEYRRKLTGSFVVHLKDGRWIKTTDRPTSKGGFVSIQSDITDIKKHEAQLLQAKEQAELANRAKSDFMANMSHELRTPLNAIIGFASLLTSEVYGPHQDPRYREYSLDIEEAGSHLLTLINELLDLAKIEAGTIQLNEQVTDLSPLTQSCKTMIDSRAKQRNIHVTSSVEPTNLQLMADPIRLKQILVNLTGNAVKFSKENGSVDIAWFQRGENIVLAVEDDGVGMEQEFIPKLFQPFKRSRIAQDMQSEGTGLGLTLVKRFCDAHGANIHVESMANQGTRVEIEFPAYRNVHTPQVIAS
ncbi:PAS domain-containing sensor histidine kinase [Sneathiella limimaris]|uniref:PAS domain-containing sensor histidine kinase n=1 Tax=Sneathiella limimaris TaxID=1964213 RepID=UPI00146C94EB|nr:PAS domain-containing sensor histidine kinase [Sneathiella limimaris]